jgi:hypothetical protein
VPFSFFCELPWLFADFRRAEGAGYGWGGGALWYPWGTLRNLGALRGTPRYLAEARGTPGYPGFPGVSRGTLVYHGVRNSRCRLYGYVRGCWTQGHMHATPDDDQLVGVQVQAEKLVQPYLSPRPPYLARRGKQQTALAAWGSRLSSQSPLRRATKRPTERPRGQNPALGAIFRGTPRKGTGTFAGVGRRGTCMPLRRTTSLSASTWRPRSWGSRTLARGLLPLPNRTSKQ